MTEVAKPMDPMTDFQNKVIEKLRKDIGEMLPPEALAELAKKAVSLQFFEPRRVQRQYQADEIKPSWFVEEVAKLARPIIEQQIANYLEVYKEEVQKAVYQFCESQNLMLLALAALRTMTYSDIDELAGRVAQRLKNGF